MRSTFVDDDDDTCPFCGLDSDDCDCGEDDDWDDDDDTPKQPRCASHKWQAWGADPRYERCQCGEVRKAHVEVSA